MRYIELFDKYKELEKTAVLSILEELTHIPRSSILAHQEEAVPKQIEPNLYQYLKRLQKHEPLAYILGYKEFYGLKFKVDPSTLIPRPETERLVELALKNISRRNNKVINILEIGTGSGCISTALLHEFDKTNKPSNKTLNLTLTDINKKACKIAKTNTENLLSKRLLSKISIEFANVIKNSDSTAYDLVISNPPYIPRRELPTLDKNVKDFEPLLALDGGEDGLDVFREILHKTRNNTTPNTTILFEIHENLAKQVTKLLREYYPKAELHTHKDFAKKDRFVEANLS